MLADTELAHWEALKLSAVEVTYTDSTATETTLSLVPASPQAELFIDSGFASQDVDKAFITSVAELRTASVTPSRGATIEYTDSGGTARRYEVMPGNGEQLLVPMGNYGVMVKIHAKEIAVAAP